jgi:nucleotide-binding universal stress UspA family protein
MVRDANAYLEKVAGKLRAKKISVKTLVTFGHTAEEIVKAARETKAHLIAMSTHGRSGIVRWAIGSVTDKVMRLEGTIPVMAVKATGEKVKGPAISMDSLPNLAKNS